MKLNKMSSKLKYIVKNKPLPIAQDLEALKSKGIDLAKQLSGDIWTDFNEHDPGVTVLENLCFAIMEMSYKANLDFEQLFFAKENIEETENIEDYFLLKKEQIQYTNPISLLDYRKTLLDHLDENIVKNIWVEADMESIGAYRIYVYTEDQEEERLKEKILETYNKYRNFGEKCSKEQVIILTNTPIQDSISTAISKSQYSEDVITEAIAQLIYDIKNYIEPPIRFAKTIKKLNLKQENLVALKQGPLPSKKFIHPKDLLSTSLEKMTKVIDIAAFINQNAEKWNNLVFVEDSILKLPRINNSNNQILVFDVNKFINKIEEPLLRSKIRAAYQKKAIKPLLNGKVEWKTYHPKSNLSKKDLKDYYSIQYTFPQNYNLGLENIDTLDSVSKKQVKNLQNYLLLFESLLSDFLVKLISFPELLKISKKNKNTKIETEFVAILNKIPSSLNVDKEKIKSIYEKYSFNKTKQIQIREYALARYGEFFDIDLIKRAWGEPEDFEEKWLKQLNELMVYYSKYSIGRHNSFNIKNPLSDFPLSRKLSILLNQDYDLENPNVYVIESNLLFPEKNDLFGVVIILDLKINQPLSSKRQLAIIQLIKEEFPFYLNLSKDDFLFLGNQNTGAGITTLKDLFGTDEQNILQDQHIERGTFKNLYKAWRNQLAG